MKIVSTILRVLLGLIFFVFGLNGFLHFLPMPPLPPDAQALLGAFANSGYMLPLLFGTQVVGGLLLILGLFVPLALTLLAPVVVHIIFFHVFLAPGGLPLAIVVAAIEAYLAWLNFDAFAPLFGARPGTS